MITKTNELVYIENFKLLASFLNNSEDLAKLRTKIGDDRYAVNGIVAKRIGDMWMLSFIAPNRLKPKSWILSGEKAIKEFKGLFGEILTDNNILLPYFLKFSSSLDDNIFINLEVKNFLNKLYNEVASFKEES